MYLTVNGARLFFDTVGPHLAVDGERMSPRTALVVLHGGPGFDHSLMRPYFDRFADTHQVVYLDHRGNGRSGGAPETWLLSQWGDDLRAFCDALGIDKPVVLGQSFGGMVAMVYAARHPGHASKLVLSSTAARLDPLQIIATLERLGGKEARAVGESYLADPTIENTMEYLRKCLPLYNPRPSPDFEQAKKRAILRMEVTMAFIGGEQRTMDLRPSLAKVSCPTLVLAGALDPVCPPQSAHEMMAALPRGVARLELVPTAGHGVHRDEPALAESILRRFLAEP